MVDEKVAKTVVPAATSKKVGNEYKEYKLLTKEEMKSQFYPFKAVITSNRSRRVKYGISYNAFISINPSLELQVRLSKALIGVIKAERGLDPNYDGELTLNAYIRFVQGSYKDDQGNFIFAEVKFSKSVITRTFLTRDQMMLLNVMPDLLNNLHLFNMSEKLEKLVNNSEDSDFDSIF